MLKLDLKLKLEEIQQEPNIAELIDKDKLDSIAKHCHKGYMDDASSLHDWMSKTKQVVKAASLESNPNKTVPFIGAADVKLPMVVSSIVQYAARTYGEIVRNGEVVQAAVIGEDPDGSKADRAKRISAFMSYQLLFKDPDWEEDTDKLLNSFPLTGMAFRKTYYDPIKKAPRTETCLWNEVIMSNHATSLEDARRISHVLCIPRNEVVEKQRARLYSEIDEAALQAVGGEHTDGYDTFEIIEQHTFLDLDGDGYEEPYVVTFLEKNQAILRIVARWDSDGVERNEDDEVLRITPVQYFTCFKFLPSPDGRYYGIGLGQLMHGIMETSNSIVNNLIDSGNMSNNPCGFIDSALTIPGGDDVTFELGEFKKVDFGMLGDNLGNHIYKLDVAKPDGTLLQLLGILNSYGKEIASINEALTGDMKTQNVPATTALAVINQGSKVLGSVQRRLYRALQQEFDKLYRINRLYLSDEEYFTTMDTQLAIAQSDFEDKSIDIRPVADPNMSSDVQRMQKAQAEMALIGQPGVNAYEIIKDYLRAMGSENIDKKVQPPDPNAPPPPEMIQLQAQLDMQGKQLEIAKEELFIKKRELSLKEAEVASKALLNEKKAEESVAKAVSTIHAMAVEGNRVEIERLAAKADMLAEPEKIKGADGSTKDGANKPRPDIAEELELASPTSPVGMEPMMPEEGMNVEQPQIPGMGEEPSNPEVV